MRPNPLKQLRAGRARALANGTPAPVAFSFWDDPELLTVDGASFEIHFNDLIDDWFGISAAMVVEALVTADGRDVLVHLNSPGGMYTEGLAIHSAFKQYSGNVTFRVAGLAASAASFVMLAGDRIEITDGSLVMIHDAWDVTMGPEDEHLRTANLLGKVSDSIALMYSRKAGGEPADWRTLMRAETWYAGQEAVDAGLVDAVADEEITEPAQTGEDTTAAREWAGIFASAPNRTSPRLDRVAAMAALPAPQPIEPRTRVIPVGEPLVTKQIDPPPVAAPIDWLALREGLKGVRR